MTKEISFDFVEVDTSKTTSSNSSSTQKKEPSLFDSLLKNVSEEVKNSEATKSTEDSKTSNKQVITNDNTKVSNNENSNQKKPLEKEISDKLLSSTTSNSALSDIINEEGEDNTSKQEKSPSFLDRLVRDAKNTIKESLSNKENISSDNKTAVNTIQNKDVKSTSTTLIIEEEESSEDKESSITSKTTNVISKDEIKVSNLNKTQKVDIVSANTISSSEENNLDSSTDNSNNVDNNDNTTNLVDTKKTKESLDNNKNKTIEDSLKSSPPTLSSSLENENKEEVQNDSSSSNLNKENKENTLVNKSINNLQNNKQEKESTKTIKTDLTSKEESSELENKTLSSDSKIEKNTLVENSKNDNLLNVKEVVKDSSKSESKLSSIKSSNLNIDIEKNTNDTKPLKNEDKKDTSSISSTSTKALNSSTNVETISVNNTKNDKVAKELASLNTSENLEEVNIDESVLKSESKEIKKESKSLFDRIISNEKNIKTSTASVNEEKVSKSVTLDTSSTKDVSSDKKNDILTNIFLSSQKKSYDEMSSKSLSTATSILKNATSIEEVKEGAKVLDLNMKSSKLEHLGNTLKSLPEQNSLERIAFNKNIVKVDFDKMQSAITSMQNSSTSSNEEEVSLNVNPTLANDIISKIVSAKQQLSSMMSDIAKKMYENYKPPVTAFKINLNPSTLGSIAIVMKSSNSGLSVSLNMSKSSTLDAMVDSQASLKSALSKNFEGNNISLDFTMNEENSSETSDFSSNDSNDNNMQENKTFSSSLNINNQDSSLHEDEVLNSGQNNYM